ncbi:MULTISPECIES: hypothetical protein [Pseudoalteromonas]|uniref:Uncharacterized protein n=1 Tax=Pseudoalteromonas amylolytica TaxID=1859457 RepID=A0A1S1MJW9_9GAMM|nr:MULTISPECIES: hypothetical protein [Pseudoalteromonas]OHU85486.1 hypothetical protein BFC16_19235 [Pseudoalteromonas sp. JW3]OHU87265.1 hypothetical protein BET10_00040 [Pseudoalteromonas amylolytica]
MQCIYLNGDGTLTATSQTLSQCEGYVLVSASDAQAFTAATQITSLDIAEAFTWGFGLIITIGFISYQVRVARKLIKTI